MRNNIGSVASGVYSTGMPTLLLILSDGSIVI